jgi:hypothetical protein
MGTPRNFVSILAVLFLSLLCGCSAPKASKIIQVEVAFYNQMDEATAWPLTFGTLHQHGILAGGWGNGAIKNSGIHVCVPPTQVVQAHKLLRDELPRLSQKQKDSFQIVWR